MRVLRSCCALLLLCLLVPRTVSAQEAAPADATAPVSAANQRLLSQVGGGILGGLVGGLLGAGAGVVLDLRRCMLWCSPQPSHVPRTTLLGAGAGVFSGVFIATALTDAPTAEAAQEARLERILIDPRARSLGLSGRF